MLRSIIITACIILINGLSAQHITSLAVLDFEGRGVADHEAASLTDWLRTEMSRVGSIPLVERSAMLEILIREQDLGLLDCTSDACVIQIGQLLQVSHVVAGSIGQVGTTFTITARTVSVETGQIVNIINRRYQGSIEGLFDEMTPIAYEIVSRKDVWDRMQQETFEAEQKRKDEIAKRAGNVLKGIIYLSAGIYNVADGFEGWKNEPFPENNPKYKWQMLGGTVLALIGVLFIAP